MEYEKNDVLRERVFDNIRETVTAPREGVHLSDLIYCTRKAYWRHRGMSQQPTDNQCLLWMTGFAFQAYMFPLDKEVPVLVDGVNCTPDIPTGIEVKTTRQSSKKFDFDSMRHWHRQILGYCRALNMLDYDLVVMFVCGNYAPPFPQLECYHITATQEEVDINWLEVLYRADKLQTALAQNIPPVPDPEDWEYKYCENVDLCPDSECWRRREMERQTKEAKNGR